VSGPSWDDLSKPRRGSRQPDELPSDTPEELVMRVLSGREGERFRDFLRAETIEKRNTPNASDAELRELEAQRRFVARLELMATRGAEISASRSKPKRS
jgi:hypothetical protein